MAANKIIEKIQEDASQESAAILENAHKKAEAVSTKILAAAHSQIENIEKQSKLDGEEATRRQVLIAELESRKRELSSKREIIEETFAAALEQLIGLPKDKWEKLITKIVLEASETGTEQICVPACDRAKYENGFLAQLNAALVAQGKKGQLTLSEVPAKFTGGIMLLGKNSDFDGSFATLLQDIRTKEERQVADLLFGTEVK